MVGSLGGECVTESPNRDIHNFSAVLYLEGDNSVSSRPHSAVTNRRRTLHARLESVESQIGEGVLDPGADGEVRTTRGVQLQP